MADRVDRKDLPDIQNIKDTRGKFISRAGVTNVSIPLKIGQKDQVIAQPVQANVSMYVSVDETTKGANMCYDDQTEILTKSHGWVLFKDLRKSDYVATLDRPGNSITGEKFVWKKPTKYFEDTYKGKMFSVECRGINLCVTPNHNLLVFDSKFKIFPELMRADEFFDKTTYRMSKRCNWCGMAPKYIEITTTSRKTFKKRSTYQFPVQGFMKLLGFYLAEGCAHKDKSRSGGYQVIWSNSDKNILKELAHILKNQDINSSISKNGSAFNLVVSNKTLYEYFKKLKKSPERFIPQDIKELAIDYLQTLFEYYMLGDGSHTKTSKSFYTASQRLADDLQEIGIKCGIGVHIKPNTRPMNAFKPGAVYYVGYLTNNLMPTVNSSRKGTSTNRNKWVDYNGKIYCCTVPNHTLMVRRKGIPIWSGNSRFLETLMAYEACTITSKDLEQVIEDMLKRLESQDGYISIAFKYFVSRFAPVSNSRGTQGYDVTFIGKKVNGQYVFVMEVSVMGTNLCPCSKEISQYGAHNQRNTVRLRLVPTEDFYWIEDIIDALEGQMSSPIYPLLKREDEKFVTETAYENPKFVEDLARDVAVMLDEKGVAHYHIRSTAEESIHLHEATATISKEWVLE